jgi:hypothetical protein
VIARESTISSAGSSSYYNHTDTLYLDERGLVKQYRSVWDYDESGISRPVLKYDSNGFLIRNALVDSDLYVGAVYNYYITDSNITSLIHDADGGFGRTIIQYGYYQHRPNLPNQLPFFGQDSRNLRASQLELRKGSAFDRDGPKYRTVYLYDFDRQGRVSHQITHGVYLKPDWSFTVDKSNFGITYYEYECL